MKTLLSIALVLLASALQAQIINIPDANFKYALVNTSCAGFDDLPFTTGDADTNNDGEIEVAEALAVKNLFFNLPPPFTPGGLPMATMEPPSDLTDLTGIEAFLNLKILDISGNQLTTLDVSMLSQLEQFYCYSNQLASLTLGNNPNLFFLSCHSNQLTALDVSGLSGLETIYCSDNQLAALDVSGLNLLNYLSCGNNQIGTISFGGNFELERVYANDNLFATLDLSLTSTSFVYAYNNPNLSQVNLKNGVNSPLEITWPLPLPAQRFENTPLLTNICADEDEISNIVANLNGQPVLVTPYCNFGPGGDFNTIAGTMALDCDGLNVPIANQKIQLGDGTISWYTFTDDEGHYVLYAGQADYTVAALPELPDYFTVTPASHNITFTSGDNVATANFCAITNGIHPDVEISLIPLTALRPGFDAGYKIVYTNKGTEIGAGNVSVAFDDSILDYVSASPAESTQATNLVTWAFDNLLPFESREITVAFNANSPSETPSLNVGDVTQLIAMADAGADDHPDDNSMTLSQTAVGAIDPNDKTVSRETIGPAELGECLYYTVRFQNVGTFYAENIVVRDMLSANLDLTTLQMVSASHQYRSSLSGNRLEFFFEGINLPAAQDDEPDSHGYVTFKVKPKNTLVINDVIENSADIYFDFEWPVTTNSVATTVTALGNHGVAAEAFAFYPNPVNDRLSVASELPIDNISVYNTIGQLVKSVSRQNAIDLSELSGAMYLVKIESGACKFTKTIIKI